MADNKFKQTKAGGVIANSDGVTNDGFKGGVFIGQRHSEGGIQVVVDGGGRAEIEDAEPVLIPSSVNAPGTKTFDGKPMTNKQILSKINTNYGGVEIKRRGGLLKKGGSVKSFEGYILTKETDEYCIYKCDVVKYQWLVTYMGKILVFTGKNGLSQFTKLRNFIESEKTNEWGSQKLIESTLNDYLSTKHKEYKDGCEILLAPNGQPTNLTPEQYKLTRSKAFIAWFGDFINDPKSASKVVDENGDPLVVYHGTANDFTVFDKKKIGVNYYQSERGGFFFAQKEQSAKNYAYYHSNGKEGYVIEAFLNIKKPYIRKGVNSDYLTPIHFYDMHRGDFIKEKDRNNSIDGFIVEGNKKDNLYVLFDSNKIKLADGANTTFDSGNPDIRYKKGGNMPEKIELPDNIKNGEIVVPANAVIITRGAALDTDTKHEFNGEMLTNIEILSKINESGGGAPFDDVIPAKIQVSEKVYKFDGQSANDSAIAHKLGINSILKKGGQLFLFKGKEYDVAKAYDLIKKRQIDFKIEKEDTFPSKYSNYDKNYKDTADYRLPQGLMIKHNSGKCLLIDGNHRMNKAYEKGLKTIKVYYVSDPKDIDKFSRDIEFELGGNLHDDESFASCGCQHEKEEFKEGGEVDLVKIYNEPIVTFKDFHLDTFADFKKISKKEIPKRLPDFKSNSGSKYWYVEDYVIRESNHWGRTIASCNWLLDSKAFKGLSQGKCLLKDFHRQRISLLYKETNIGKKFKVCKTSLIRNGGGRMDVSIMEGVFKKKTFDYYIFDDFKVGNLTLAYVEPINEMATGGEILLAPNGKPTNLTQEQYKLTRSKAFINWFGDFINDPKNASKVVDENGDPLVVWHATSKEFTVFDKKKSKEGFYFSPIKERLAAYHKLKVLSFFLNIKNPSSDEFDRNGFDGVMDFGANKKHDASGLYEIIAFYPEQIKLSDGTNTEFDPTNPDIRFARGGQLKTDAFKKWFGNSKVIDEKGDAKVMYHGTVKDFTEFKKGEYKNTNHPSASLGFFFGDYRVAQMFVNPKWDNENENNIKRDYLKNRRDELGIRKLRIQLDELPTFDDPKYYPILEEIGEKEEIIANEWGEITNWIKGLDYGSGANLMPVYLSIQKPFEMSFRDILNLGGGVNESEKKVQKRVSSLKAELIKEGYDGVRILPSDLSDESEFEQYIAFYPTQIKSAIGNIGTYDSTNPDIRFKAGGTLSEYQEATYKKWKHLVNMSVLELKKFYDSEEGKKAGLSVEEAHKLHIHNGRESARWIMKMIPVSHKEWTPEMWEWANRQISFISRMKGNPGALYDDKGNKTRKHTSLLIWGHNPEKFGGGGDIDTRKFEIDAVTDKIQDALESDGYYTTVNHSNTDFGLSNYIYIANKKDDSGIPLWNSKKIRISDHGVSNIDRMQNEIHVSLPIVDETKEIKNVLNEVHWFLDRDKYFRPENGFQEKKGFNVQTKLPLEDDIITKEFITKAGNKQYEVVRTYKIPVTRWYNIKTGAVYEIVENGKYELGGGIFNQDNLEKAMANVNWNDVFSGKNEEYDKQQEANDLLTQSVIANFDKKISENENQISDWSGRKYKKNENIVFKGDDDIHGDAMSIGSINEGKRNKKIRSFQLEIDALNKAKEILANYRFDSDESILDSIIKRAQSEDYIINGKKMSISDQMILESAYDKLIAALKERSNAMQGGGEILLAPNGKPSNLNSEQWHLVRTPEFIAWFGDWINNPQDTSKVLDNQGEPLVCYHGFMYNYEGVGKFNTFKNLPAFFSVSQRFAEDYASTKSQDAALDADIASYACFLNLKKLFNPEDLKCIALAEKMLPDEVEVSHGTAWFLSAKIPKATLIEEMQGISTIEPDDMTEQVLNAKVGDIVQEKISSSQYENKLLLYKDDDTAYLTNRDKFNSAVEYEIAEYISTERHPKTIKYKGKYFQLLKLNEDTYRFEVNTDPLAIEFTDAVEDRKKYYIDNIKSFDDGKHRFYFYIQSKNPKGHESSIFIKKINLKTIKIKSNDNWTMFENEAVQSFLKENKFDGWVALERGKKSYGVYAAENIKLADGTNTTFDANSPDIRYEKGGVTNNNAFKKWFGNSKVVNKKGMPLEVYHGSADLRGLKEDYIFKTKREVIFGAPEEHQSFFFTDSYSIAKSYADPHKAFDYQNAEEGVMSVYLSIQNPLLVDAGGQVWRKFELEIMGEKLVGTTNIITFAHKNNYDGVIIKNVKDYYNKNDNKNSSGNVYVAFKPTQIKIADNNTTFDSNNPDMRFDGGGTVADYGKVISASSRFRPAETIVFDPPLVGINGNKLVSYTWAYEWTMLPNFEGELVSKRISNWDQAGINADTGRGIVHKYDIEMPDKTLKEVSSDSVPIMLGYIDRKQMTSFPNLVTAAKTLAKLQLKLSIEEAKEKEWKELEEKVSKMPKPPFELAKLEDLPFVTRALVHKHPGFLDDVTWWKLGEFTEREEKPNSKYPDFDTKQQLNQKWESKKIESLGGIKPSGLYDLRGKVDRQKRRVDEILKNAAKFNEVK